MSNEDDFYALLGVDSDAPTGDIRSAYRDKKAALGDQGDKTATARLNKAWNVLSDPYQRGRYDEQRMRAAGGDGDGDGVESARTGPVTARDKTTVDAGPAAGAPAPLQITTRRAGEMPPPTISARRRRCAAALAIIAMVIDVFVMIVLLFGVRPWSATGWSRWYPQNAATAITDDPPGKAKARSTRSRTRLTRATTQPTKPRRTRPQRCITAQDRRCRQEAFDDKNDEIARLSKKVAPAGIVVLEGIMLACLAYLVVPSALIGQTLGKRIQKLRVIHLDGSPLGWGGALIRYGLIILATNAALLFPILGVIGIAIVFFFVLSWMRNPNHMGLQDKVAKTVVVEA
jgi:hypothetical protein